MRKITFALVALFLLAAGYALAQISTTNKVTVVVPQGGDPTVAAQAQLRMNEPLPISDQLGLRIEGEHDGRVYGTLVVKVDGRWVDVQLASKAIRAH